jgi:predicted amidohydrolase
MKFRLALAQIDPVLGDMQANIGKHIALADRAAAAGAQVVVFPRAQPHGVFDQGHELGPRAQPPGDPGPLHPLIEKGKTISILAGGVEEGGSFGLYNAAFFFEGGEVRSVHRKTYPPTYGMFEENRYFSSGTEVRAFDSKHGRFGVLICEDLWHLPLPVPARTGRCRARYSRSWRARHGFREKRRNRRLPQSTPRITGHMPGSSRYSSHSATGLALRMGSISGADPRS